MNFTTITTKEIEQLATAKLSGAATQVYLCLRLHCFADKTTCFPSIKRVSKLLNNIYSERTIQRSLKQLEETGIIKRNKAHTMNRFVLKAKEVAHLAAEKAKDVAKKLRQKSAGNKTDLTSQKKNKRIEDKSSNFYWKNKKRKPKKSVRPHITVGDYAESINELKLPNDCVPFQKIFKRRVLALENHHERTQEKIDSAFAAGRELHESIWEATKSERKELRALTHNDLSETLKIVPSFKVDEIVEKHMREIVRSRYPKISAKHLWDAINFS